MVIWGFMYGATAMSAVGLPLNALFSGLGVRYAFMPFLGITLLLSLF
jgi:hypothetical protein